MTDQEDIFKTTTFDTDITAVEEPAAMLNGASNEDDFHLMEQLLSDPAHAYHNFQYGDTVDGTIVRIDKDAILVDIGAKAEGVVPAREMQSLSSEDRDSLHIGAELLVFVVQAEHREGYSILSVDRARQERSWRRLQQAFERGEPIVARVANYNKGGLLVSLEGVRGFVPSSQVTAINRGPETQKQSEMARLIGSDLTLKIIEINRDRNRLILSERQAVQEAREERKDELLSELREGQIYPGLVSSVCDFGVFVDIGGADGLVHLSELSWGRVKHPSEILSAGDKVQVYILSIDYDRRRIALSIKRTQAEPWATASERYYLNQIVEGTVTQLAAFGAFARIEDGIEGLIHVSEMGEGHIQHPREVVAEGDVVQARIIRIDPARKRIGLSLRLRSESEGEEEQHTTPDDDDATVHE
ncbi:MAG: 30S ribosomal protein S1 [Chloroflexaceae bacterium]|nr:30S ribosomal protein S1 [Chloroflexaceae bacterium]NJO04592.1 30S ribosomal protein S1 [Chloroflexaceae bacterium]